MAKMPGDTLTPLMMTLSLTVLFSALLFKLMWIALAGVVACIVTAGVWLWPEPERTV